MGQSLVGSLLLSPQSWCTQGSVCALQDSVSQSCVSSGNSMVGLMATSCKTCRTQVYCTQSPCPCSSPLLTCTSSGDTPTQFCLILCGVSGSWCTQGMFEPSEHLWQVWGLILNAISPLLPSFWGFSFDNEWSRNGRCYHEVGTSLVAQTIKRLSAMQETQVRSLGWEDPLEKEMAAHSSILAWKIQ